MPRYPSQGPLSAATGGLWSLRLLGAFELTDGRQRHSKLGTRAAMALLARLCLQPGVAHPRETLVELLWPDAEASAGKQRLRQTLSTLKQVLEPAEQPGFEVIEADRFNIRLLPGRVQCDAVAFEEAFRRGEHDRARELYAGELLPGFFDEWIGDERLRLEGLFDRLRAPSAASAAAPSASTASAVPAPNSAGAAAARASGEAPTATQAASTGPRHAALPAYLTRMVGADPQTRLLRQAVIDHRLVTLMGPGGTGKTRLAVEVAHAMSVQGEFETVAWLPLAPCRTRQQVLDQVLLSLNLPTGQAGALAGIVHALDGRRALLVLDNFEQVVDEAAEVVGELGARLPLLHQLVTSRRALSLPGEREMLVAALALPAPEATLEAALQSPAVALFVERARATRAEFHLHPGNLAAVVELLRLLDGMPLAIELAAARVRSMAPAEMAATLRQAREGKASALDLLERAPQRGRQDSRHHSMQATIAWSWDLLGDAQRALLAALTVFQGGFSADAAAAVCSTAATPAGSIAWLLDELLAHSLLRLQAEGDAMRFALYEPIREFAQRQLSPEAAAALRRRHGTWALAWVRSLPVTPALPMLQAELPNLVAAMSNGLADGAPQQAIELALALDLTLEEVKLPGAALATLASALEICDDPALKSQGLGLLGLLEFLGGHGVESLRRIDQGLALAPGEPPALRARALLLAAQAAHYRKESSVVAEALLDEAQGLSPPGDTAAQARIASCRADIASAHDPSRAAALQRSALAMWSARGDRMGVMRAHYRLAILAYDMRDYPAMLAEIDPVVDEARQLQAWLRLSGSLNVRGGALAGLRRWREAAVDTRASMQMAWQALAPRHMAAALTILPYLMLRTGQTELGVRLAGFISVYWPHCFGPLPERDVEELRRVQRLSQRLIGAARSEAAYAAGQRLTVADAVAQALAVPASSAAPAAPAAPAGG